MLYARKIIGERNKRTQIQAKRLLSKMCIRFGMNKIHNRPNNSRKKKQTNKQTYEHNMQKNWRHVENC